MLLQLITKEGVFVGVSAAAAVLAAYRLATELTHGLIVVLLPDSGMKYLSQPFWREK
jgi:cysteine synthase